MIKNIMIIMVFFAAAFLINIYYKKSSIVLKDNRVVLNVKDKSLFLDYSLEKSESLTFSNVNIAQKKLKIEGNSIFFEVATVDSMYEFNRNLELVVRKTFEAKKLNKIFSVNGLIAMEVVLKNDKTFNLFVEESGIDNLKFFYGIPTDIFKRIVKKLQGRDANLLYQNSMESLSKPISHWSVKHNDLDGVIQAIDD